MMILSTYCLSRRLNSRSWRSCSISWNNKTKQSEFFRNKNNTVLPPL
jgi:hypothetical protein